MVNRLGEHFSCPPIDGLKLREMEELSSQLDAMAIDNENMLLE